MVGHRRPTPHSTGAATCDDAGLDECRPSPLGTIESNALTPYIRAFWDITPEARIYIETVHRLTDLGAVVTHATHATSREGFDAEWARSSF